MLSFKLFGLVFCLFRFNRNIEALCFGIEVKQPKQTVLTVGHRHYVNKQYHCHPASGSFVC
jgi:hypothetical protein